MSGRLPLRWVAMFVFTLASALSFLDRQLLAALAPVLRAEFHLSNTDYGLLVSVFSIAYATSAPLSGLLIDRIGLNRGISLAISIWSLAGLATGLVRSFGNLLLCRALLGIGESGGIPASGKAIAVYLLPKERAMGSAFGQLGITIGMVGAPVFATWMVTVYGWRGAFVCAGLLGFLWLPIWWWMAARLRRHGGGAAVPPGPPVWDLLRDTRLWAMVVVNVLSMTAYSLWTNWTTLFLVESAGLPQHQANLRFAWVPPIFAALGGMAGGALSLRFASGTRDPSCRAGGGHTVPSPAASPAPAPPPGGAELFAARYRACRISGVALLATALAPLAPHPALATAAICWSFFWSVAFSVNVYALPLDFFGAGRAAFGVSALTSAYGLMQTVLSPLIGAGIDRYGFTPVCAVIGILPLGAVGVMKWMDPNR